MNFRLRFIVPILVWRSGRINIILLQRMMTDDNHTLYIREADTIPELVNAEEKLILDSTTYPHVGNLLWAPEFHEINGKALYFPCSYSG